MLGRHTHGVALSPLYIEQLEKGLMAFSGQPEFVRDNGSTVVWDGNYLPGLWLVQQALDLAQSFSRGLIQASAQEVGRDAAAKQGAFVGAERGVV